MGAGEERKTEITVGGRREGWGGREGERTLEGGGGGWVGFLFCTSDEAGECMDGFAAAAGTASFF